MFPFHAALQATATSPANMSMTGAATTEFEPKPMKTPLTLEDLLNEGTSNLLTAPALEQQEPLSFGALVALSLHHGEEQDTTTSAATTAEITPATETPFSSLLTGDLGLLATSSPVLDTASVSAANIDLTKRPKRNRRRRELLTFDYQCKFCDKAYASFYARYAHYKRKHNGQGCDDFSEAPRRKSSGAQTHARSSVVASNKCLSAPSTQQQLTCFERASGEGSPRLGRGDAIASVWSDLSQSMLELVLGPTVLVP